MKNLRAHQPCFKHRPHLHQECSLIRSCTLQGLLNNITCIFMTLAEGSRRPSLIGSHRFEKKKSQATPWTIFFDARHKKLVLESWAGWPGISQHTCRQATGKRQNVLPDDGHDMLTIPRPTTMLHHVLHHLTRPESIILKNNCKNQKRASVATGLNGRRPF